MDTCGVTIMEVNGDKDTRLESPVTFPICWSKFGWILMEMVQYYKECESQHSLAVFKLKIIRFKIVSLLVIRRAYGLFTPKILWR